MKINEKLRLRSELRSELILRLRLIKNFDSLDFKIIIIYSNSYIHLPILNENH